MYDLKAVGSPTSNLWLKRMIQMYNPKAVGSPASNLHNLDLEADLQRQPVTFFPLSYLFLLHHTHILSFHECHLDPGRCTSSSKAKLGTTFRHITAGEGTPLFCSKLFCSKLFAQNFFAQNLGPLSDISQQVRARPCSISSLLNKKSSAGTSTANNSATRIDWRHLQGHRAG